MLPVTNANWLSTLVGELCLFAAAIMWWDLILRGVSSLGVVPPVAFTLVGVFWLGKALGRTGSYDRVSNKSRDRDGGIRS